MTVDASMGVRPPVGGARRGSARRHGSRSARHPGRRAGGHLYGGGDGHLERPTLRDNVTGSHTEVAAAGLFILIGAEPHTDWLPDEIDRDERGCVRTGSEIPPER